MYIYRQTDRTKSPKTDPIISPYSYDIYNVHSFMVCILMKHLFTKFLSPQVSTDLQTRGETASFIFPSIHTAAIPHQALILTEQTGESMHEYPQEMRIIYLRIN